MDHQSCQIICYQISVKFNQIIQCQLCYTPLVREVENAYNAYLEYRTGNSDLSKKKKKKKKKKKPRRYMNADFK